jgi:hypothetical protein
MSLLAPTFIARLSDPTIKTVMLSGCGGGFDFVHAMTLYPELMRLGKNVIIASNSFGNPNLIEGEAPTVFRERHAVAKRVTVASVPDPYYGPEVHLCGFLDERYPEHAPHFAYAYYARSFTVSMLRRFYQQLIAEHAIDAIILIDGGSDSLMAGDEEGLGDPIEDATSVATVASLDSLKFKLLFSISLGTDRYLHVSDAASLRAVAELTAAGGFLGAISLTPDHPGFQFYRNCIEYIYARQAFRSVHVGMILSSVTGHFGGDPVPPPLADTRVKSDKLFVWPLMTMLWAFDVDRVAERSKIAKWISDCETILDAYVALEKGREELGENLRDVENLPRHEDMRG